jgi:hypothetical protein
MSDESVWGGAEVMFSAPAAITASFSKAGTQFAVVFSNNELRLEPDAGQTSLTQVVSFRAPVTVAHDQQLTGYLQGITFGVSRTPDVRVLIVADLAGTVRTMEFDYELSDAAPVEIPFKSWRFVSLQGVESAGAGLVGLFGPVADYVATISITIQRRSLKGHGSVSVDGVDVDALLFPPPRA